MTGKAYYLTTLADWQRHAARFANSHFIVLDAVEGQGFSPAKNDRREAPSLLPQAVAEPPPERHDSSVGANRDLAIRILVLIEADEGVHLSLDDDPTFEPLPHPFAQKAISAAVQSALASHGVAPGATTFETAETLARVHPLLRHRVF